jgi:RNA polymerase sigma-70 factor (ECF subfamily)
VQDERNLVQLAQEGNTEAFAELYEAYFNKIYRYIALKLGQRMEAEDITQKVFLKALDSISSYKWRNIPFSAWLFRIAHNLVIDHYRKSQRQSTLELNEEIVASKNRGPEKVVEIKLDIEWLAKETAKLTNAQREVLSLRFAGELPIAQVAKVMGRSEGAIKALQHSAIVTLRKAAQEMDK